MDAEYEEPYRTAKVSAEELQREAVKEGASQLELLAMSRDGKQQGKISAIKRIEED